MAKGRHLEIYSNLINQLISSLDHNQTCCTVKLVYIGFLKDVTIEPIGAYLIGYFGKNVYNCVLWQKDIYQYEIRPFAITYCMQVLLELSEN